LGKSYMMHPARFNLQRRGLVNWDEKEKRKDNFYRDLLLSGRTVCSVVGRTR